MRVVIRAARGRGSGPGARPLRPARGPVRSVSTGRRTEIPRPVAGPNSMPLQNPYRHDR